MSIQESLTSEDVSKQEHALSRCYLRNHFMGVPQHGLVETPSPGRHPPRHRGDSRYGIFYHLDLHSCDLLTMLL